MIACMLLTVSLVSQTALASCNPRDIRYSQPNDYYVYPTDCHVEFGQLRQDMPKREEQVGHLKKALELKDLAIEISDERTENWKKTTYKLEDKLLTIEKNNGRLKWIYFGIGILTMGAAVYGASQLKR